MQMREYHAALYMRLSKDDGAIESASIKTQRKLLYSYVKENNLKVYDEYVDDGFSGTNFQRPAFLKMIEDIENGFVNMVITKDLSRLGRDYIKTGEYTEIYFPSKKVRYVAVNDGYDSDSEWCDIAPFKNVINEMYARDISAKIRSSLREKMRCGEFVGAFAPYGYRRSAIDRKSLEPDYEAAENVRFIFYQASQGNSSAKIAKMLNENHVLTPLEYRYGYRIDGLCWSASTVSKILSNVVYLGHMAQGKTKKVSFKSRKSVSLDKNDWYVVPNTHAPIVSEELFHLASRRKRAVSSNEKTSFCNCFSNTAKCADCAHNMSFAPTKRKGGTGNLVCALYKSAGKNVCSNHLVSYDNLEKIVAECVGEQLAFFKTHIEKIVHEIYLEQEKKNKTTLTFSNSQGLKKKIDETQRIIEKIYNDMAVDIIDEESAKKLLMMYGKRIKNMRAQLAKTIDEKTKTVLMSENNILAAAYEIIEPEKITADFVLHFIERIEIGQGEYKQASGGRIKEQDIKIFFRFDCENEEKYISF